MPATCGKCKASGVSVAHVRACYGVAVNESAQKNREFRETRKTKPAEEGFYFKNGEVYKVQLAVHGSGKPYAKRLVVTEDKTGHWMMSPGTVFHLSPEDKLTAEKAKELGHLYGVCMICGRTLTNEDSIEAGIGPVCAKRMM